MLRRLFLLLFLVTISSLAGAQTTHTVVNTDDAGPGSLRQAIEDAMSGDQILVDAILMGQQLSLTSGPLVINKNLSIAGPSSLARDFEVNGNDSLRVFEILSGITVTLASLTIKDGFSETDGGGLWIGEDANVTLISTTFSGNQAMDNGGGIFSSGGTTLLLQSVFLDDNRAVGDLSPNGGGLYNAGGFVRFNGSTITQNESVRGGGIWNTSSGTIELINSTVDSNIASLEGGGIYNNHKMVIRGSAIVGNRSEMEAGAIRNRSGDSLIVINSTISNNSAPQTGGLYNFRSSKAYIYNSTIVLNSSDEAGAGLYNEEDGFIALYSSIVALNLRNAATHADLLEESIGGIVSEGYNIIGARGSLSTQGTDQTGTSGTPFNPQIEPLFSHGGPLVHMLRSNSLGIDQGECARMNLLVDQNGNERIYDDPAIMNASDGCDVGASEFIDSGSVANEEERIQSLKNALSPAYPNPFSSKASFDVRAETDQAVVIELYDVLGQRVQTIFNGTLAGGRIYDFSIDADGLVNGVYMYRITGRSISESRMVMLFR